MHKQRSERQWVHPNSTISPKSWRLRLHAAGRSKLLQLQRSVACWGWVESVQRWPITVTTMEAVVQAMSANLDSVSHARLSATIAISRTTAALVLSVAVVAVVPQGPVMMDFAQSVIN